jgi:TIR domain
MIFLSHSWTNKPIARQLVEALARESRPAWVDEQQLDPGAELRAGLRDAIAKSDVYLYLVSEAANDSKWVQDELRFALALEFEQKLKAIPVRLAGDDTPLPALLTGRLYSSLDVAQGGGAARLASELRDVASAVVPEGCQVSATIRLLSTGLSQTLEEARLVANDAQVDALFLNERYERLDALYWTLSEVQLPRSAKGEQAELEYVAT